VLAAGVPEGVLAIVSVPADLPPLEAVAAVRSGVEEALATLGCAGVATAAVSTRCTEPAQFERAYSEARQVMSCVKTFSGVDGPRVLTADDLGPGRLFLAASNRAEADRFAGDALGPLLGAGDGMRDLLHTLRVFFDCSRSVRRSALALGIHENTIRYRLARIEDLTGLRVSGDSDDQLAAQLALLVLRLEGRLEHAPVQAAVVAA
jgi:DNA-binding PucR family transcriptional regulator